MKPPPVTFRPLELALLAWAETASTDLATEWTNAKNRQDQARAVAAMFKAAVTMNLEWLMWADANHRDDLRALMPYVGKLEQVPEGMNLAQYVKALRDAESFA